MFKGRYYIPPEQSIRQELLHVYYDGELAGHYGAEKSTELLARTDYWPHMENDIAEFIKGCAIC